MITFFPADPAYLACFEAWVNHLVHDRLFSPEDALFPKPERELIEGKFAFRKVSRENYANSIKINNIVKKSFADVQMPQYTSHSFRKTLGILMSDFNLPIEEQKAWSQNLGHKDFATTVSHYVPVSEQKQGELISNLQPMREYIIQNEVNVFPIKNWTLFKIRKEPIMALNEIYANTSSTDLTINLFANASAEPKVALLAAPFFTTMEPIEMLAHKRCSASLVFRFSPITKPSALKAASENTLVKIRYDTNQDFHTKLYLIDCVAIVGSANLTVVGLKENRELSVLLRQDKDADFQDLLSVFDTLWNFADNLIDNIFKEYTRAFNKKDRLQIDKAFEKYLNDFVSPASPPTIVVDSEKMS
ncbi:MAG: hypothetical protein COB93_00070 [Sneathiella sp.]|nr:MAG: hypothetical protein COB93_00070 [Sneathiella sp.]